MPFSVYSKLFFSCVAPVLDYGREVWGMYKLNESEKVQQSAARIFLGLNKFTPLLAIEGDTG